MDVSAVSIGNANTNEWLTKGLCTGELGAIGT